MDTIQKSFHFLLENNSQVVGAFFQHLLLSFAALLLAFLIAFPLGILAFWKPIFSKYGISFFNSIRVIPSLAVLVLFAPILGLGFLPAWLALAVLAIPPILLATYTGLKAVSPDAMEAALSLGMSPYMILYKVQLPLARRQILSGVKTAAIEVLASASLAAYIGGGGLGEYIVMGLGLYDISIMLVGAVPIALLAIVSQFIFLLLDKQFKIKGEA